MSEGLYLDPAQFAAFLPQDTLGSRTKRALQGEQSRGELHRDEEDQARRPSSLGWLLLGLGVGALGVVTLRWLARTT